MTESNQKYLAKVKSLARQLISLAEKPELGLASWIDIWGKTFDELSDLWTKGDPDIVKKPVLLKDEQTAISNLIFNLKENFHLQWSAVETKYGMVFVGRLQDGTFYAFTSKGCERYDFTAEGKPKEK